MSKIEGIPDGWELVRIGTPIGDEYFLDFLGEIKLEKGCFGLRNKNYVIVRPIAPPPPKYVPWTFETCPVGVHVRCRGHNAKGIITGASEGGARVCNTSYSYACLLSDWVQLDGTPCGTIEEAKS